MSLSHALAEINSLQTKVMRLQSQVADQEIRIKRKEQPMLDLQQVNRQLDSQLSSLYVMAKSVKGFDDNIRTHQKQSELAIILSIFVFLFNSMLLFYLWKLLKKANYE
jgi:hypothetical protein